MTIRIRSTHIEHGVKCEPMSCPIALGFIEAGFDVSIGPDFVDLYKEGVLVGTFPLPPSVQKFQRDFDDNHPVNPFEFEIALPAINREAMPV